MSIPTIIQKLGSGFISGYYTDFLYCAIFGSVVFVGDATFERNSG